MSAQPFLLFYIGVEREAGWTCKTKECQQWLWKRIRIYFRFDGALSRVSCWNAVMPERVM